MYKFLFVVFSFLIASSGICASTSYDSAQDILDKLYQSNGNQIFLKPTLELTNDTLNAALFLRRSNKIELSKKAYEACRSMGKDSISALAFILGHELAHAYQHDLGAKTTSFLAYDHCQGSNVRQEEMADVQGVFMAYLAGFQTCQILPEIIDKIYSDFNLSDQLTGYPSLAERQRTTLKVQRLAEELIQVYEAGNYLLSIGEYELATASFEYVEKWYNGEEVYNNLGVSYAWLAMNFTGKNVDQYLYPFEVSWTTRMKKPLGKRGEEDLTPAEQIKRREYLQKAKENFTIASKMSPENLTADINILCVLVLQGDYNEAIKHYNRNEISKRARFNTDRKFLSQTGRLALALAYVNSGEEEKATRIWNDVAKNRDQILAFQAEFNLKVYSEEMFDISESISCPDYSAPQILIDDVKLHRQKLGNSFLLLKGDNIQLSITTNKNSLLYTYRNAGRHFSLQRVFNSPLPDAGGFSDNTLITNMGTISTCNEQKISFLIGANGKIKEWAKFY